MEDKTIFAKIPVSNKGLLTGIELEARGFGINMSEPLFVSSSSDKAIFAFSGEEEDIKHLFNINKEIEEFNILMIGGTYF